VWVIHHADSVWKHRNAVFRASLHEIPNICNFLWVLFGPWWQRQPGQRGWSNLRGGASVIWKTRTWFYCFSGSWWLWSCEREIINQDLITQSTDPGPFLCFQSRVVHTSQELLISRGAMYLLSSDEVFLRICDLLGREEHFCAESWEQYL